jgi:predicted chitinase
LGPGVPLDHETRRFFEARLRSPLGDVRVHTDSAAASAARQLGASAFTLENHVVFGEGQYAPGTRGGRRLLAHELVHTVQQGRGTARHGDAPAPRGDASAPRSDTIPVSRLDAPSEREADSISRSVDAGTRSAHVKEIAAPHIARDPDPQSGEIEPVNDIVDPWAEKTPTPAPQPWSPKMNEVVDPWPEKTPAPAPVLQRASWSKDYGKDPKKIEAELERDKESVGKGDPADKKKGGMLELKEASAWSGQGRKRPTEVSKAQLEKIYPELAKDPKKLEEMRQKLNEAFTIMKIDTVEAQATYLAHAAAETGQLTKLTNVAGTHGDPASVGGFRGRGPLQVTLRENYVKTIAYLERAADDMEKNAKGDAKTLEQVRKMRETANAVKANPAMAADPQHAFLFSAAYMHMMRGVQSTSRVKNPQFGGASAEDVWETGQEKSFAAEKADKEAELPIAKKALADAKAATPPVPATIDAAEKRVAAIEGRISKLEVDISNAAKKKAAYDRAEKELAPKTP